MKTKSRLAKKRSKYKGRLGRRSLLNVMMTSRLTLVIFLFVFIVGIASFLTSGKKAEALSGPIFLNSANYNDGIVICSNNNCTLQTDISTPGTAIFIMVPNIVLDLNGHTITFDTDGRNGATGIQFQGGYIRDVTIGSDADNYPQLVGNWNGSNATVKNGRIVVGSSGGDWTLGAGAQYDTGVVTLDNLYIQVNGSDASCAGAQWGEYIIHDVYCRNDSTTTENRHQGPAAFRFPDAKLTAYNNIIVGGNSAIYAYSGSRIYNNVLRHSGHVTNGYGLFTYNGNDMEIYNNLIVPSNGRGIIFMTFGMTAHDNLIVAHEMPNAEFGEGLNANCIRVRYSATNNEAYDNDCVAVAGNPNTAASGAYLSDYPGTDNYIHDNEFRAITTQSSISKYANGITMEGQGASNDYAADRIENNIFGSNNYLIRLSGYDGGAYQDVIERNTLQWVGGDETVTWFNQKIDDAKYNFSYPAGNDYVTSAILSQLKTAVKAEVAGLIAGQPNNRSRATVYTGYWGSSFLSLHGTTLGANVGLQAADVYVETTGWGVGIKVGDAVNVQLKNSSGSNLANQIVTLADNTGTTQTVQTDSNGKAKLYPVAYELAKNTGSASVNKTNRTGHTVTVSGYGSISLPLGLTNTESNPYIITFGVSQCSENWSCGAWSSCVNGTQSRTCTDANNCGTTVNRPSLTQSCTSQCVENWSCGPWSGCTGTQTRTCTDANNCGTTVNRPPLSQSCTCQEVWWCSIWSSCVNGTQTRTCRDANLCGTTNNRPPLSQSCGLSCTESWSCGAWSTCVGGNQTRTCTDANNCGTIVNRPLLSQSCGSTPPPGGGGGGGGGGTPPPSGSCQENWSCSAWSSCQNGQITRSCTDSNRCGSSNSRPPLSQSCESADVTPPSAITDLYVKIIL